MMKKRKRKKDLIQICSSDLNYNSSLTNFTQDIGTELTNLKKKQLIFASTPYRHPTFSSTIDSDSGSDIQSLSDSNLMKTERSFSLISQSSCNLGDQTVAKLDNLLAQIQDIKQSVVDMDEDVFNFNTINSHFFTLAAETNLTDDDSMGSINTEPRCPSLEWDSNDIKGQQYINSTLVSNQSNNAVNLTENATHLTSSSSSSSLPISSTSGIASAEIASTSGIESISSLSETGSLDKAKNLEDLIEEARRLGLLDDFIRILLKTTKRDSAYFED